VILFFQNPIFFDQKLLSNPNILHRPWLTPFKSEGGQDIFSEIPLTFLENPFNMAKIRPKCHIKEERWLERND
jgi:hypothetical protein